MRKEQPPESYLVDSFPYFIPEKSLILFLGYFDIKYNANKILWVKICFGDFIGWVRYQRNLFKKACDG